MIKRNTPKRVYKESKRVPMRRQSSRSLRENNLKVYKIIPEANAYINYEILDVLESNYDFLIIPKSEDLVFPWDADFVIEGYNMIFRGDILPGGPGYGSCEVVIPLNKINNLIEFEVVNLPYDIIDYLEANGWKVVG